MSTTLSRALSAALIQRLHLVVEQASVALLQVQQLRSVSTSAAQHDGKRKDTSSSRRDRGGKQQPTPSAPPTTPTRPVDIPPRIGRVAPVTLPHQTSRQQAATSTHEHHEAGQEGAPDDQGQDFTSQLADRLLRQRAAAMSSGRAKLQTPSTVAAVLRQIPGSSCFTPEALVTSDSTTFTDYLRSARMGAPSIFDLGLTVAQGRPMRAWLLRWERLLGALQPHEAADPAALSGEQLEAAAGRSGVQGAGGKAVEDAIMEWVFFRRCCELLSLQRQLLRWSGDSGQIPNVQQPSRQQRHEQQGMQQESQQQEVQQQSSQLSQQQVQLPAQDVEGWQAWFFDWTLDDYASYLAAAQQGAPTIFSAGVNAAEWQEETAEKLAQSARVLSALVGAERARPLFMSSACLRDVAATAGVPAATARAVLDDFYKLKRLGFTVAAQQLLQATGQSSGAQQQWHAGSDLEAGSSQHSQSHEHDTPDTMAAGPAAAPTAAPGDSMDAANHPDTAQNLAAKYLVLQQLNAAASMSMDSFARFLSTERTSGRQGMGAGSRSARLAMLRIERIIQAMTPAEKAAVEEAAVAAQQHAAAGEDAASALLLSQEQQRRIAARCGARVSAVEVGDVLEQYMAMRKAAAETLQEHLELAGSGGT